MAVSSSTPAGAGQAPPPSAARRRPDVASALLVALLGVAAYAAFADGAVGLPHEAWLQIAVALLAALAAAAWLGAGRVRPAASPLAVAGLVLLAGLAAWTGASLAWSVAPERTWVELNRTIAYALVFAIALLGGNAAPWAVARVAVGWLAVATAVALWALAGKALPGIVDDTATVARLRAPLEYWNALGLVCVLAVPIALRIAEDRMRALAGRAAALCALVLLLACLAMTYSRGGVIALVVAVIVLTLAGGGRLRVLAAFALGVLLAAPAIAFAYASDRLSDNGVALADRIDAGLILGGILLLSLAVAVAAVVLLTRAERRVAWSPARTRATWLALAAVAFALAAAGVAALATSDPGLRGSVEEAVDAFTGVREDRVDDPGRLLSVSSGNRWAWWQEAFGGFADEPVLGWGAGSFPVSRRLYRVSDFDVLQPHSLPLQWLSELGAVGAVLGIGGLALLMAAAVAGVRAMVRGPGRDLAAALLAAAAAYLVHALFDWDWDFPAVTVPVLVFLGVLGARVPRARSVLEEESRPMGPRVAALAGTCVLLGAVIVSAALPAWSDALTDDALERASRGPESRLQGAAADAERAAGLNPLAVRPLLAAAAIAEGRDRLLEAREYLLDAVERDPYSVDAWSRLARLGVRLADREGARRSTQKLLELDPGDPDVRELVRRLVAVSAPPEASPSATGTPLPGGGVAPAEGGVPGAPATGETAPEDPAPPADPLTPAP